jgi:hypothetical protein
MGRVNLSQYKNKNYYYHIFKLDLRIESGQGLCYKGGWSLTQVNEMTKIVIIIILKPDLRVDLGQHKIKMVIITILKLNSRGSTQGKTRVTD